MEQTSTTKKSSALKRSQLAFLNKTIKHFNSTNRSIDLTKNEIQCVYYHPKFGGCAIGIHVPIDVRKKLDQVEPEEEVGMSILNDEIFSMIPMKMQKLGQNFLSEIQSLHDIKMNWNENGLTEFGKNNVQIIKQSFELV